MSIACGWGVLCSPYNHSSIHISELGEKSFFTLFAGAIHSLLLAVAHFILNHNMWVSHFWSGRDILSSRCWLAINAEVSNQDWFIRVAILIIRVFRVFTQDISGLILNGLKERYLCNSLIRGVNTTLMGLVCVMLMIGSTITIANVNFNMWIDKVRVWKCYMLYHTARLLS